MVTEKRLSSRLNFIDVLWEGGELPFSLDVCLLGFLLILFHILGEIF